MRLLRDVANSFVWFLRFAPDPEAQPVRGVAAFAPMLEAVGKKPTASKVGYEDVAPLRVCGSRCPADLDAQRLAVSKAADDPLPGAPGGRRHGWEDAGRMRKPKSITIVDGRNTPKPGRTFVEASFPEYVLQEAGLGRRRAGRRLRPVTAPRGAA